MSEKKKFLDLKPLLRSMDVRDKRYYAKLSPEDKKLFSAFLVMRYASSVDAEQFFQEHYVDSVNTLVNMNFWTLSKHPDLQWKLLSMCGSTKPMFHPYIHSGAKGKSKDKTREQVAKVLGTSKQSDIDVFLAVNEGKDIKKWLDEHQGE